MQILRIVSYSILAIALAGCASRGEIETMKRQLDYLERSSSQMQDNIVRIDSLYKLTIEANVKYQGDLKAKLSEMIDRMGMIDGKLSDIENILKDKIDRRPVPSPQPNPLDSLRTPDSAGGGAQIDQNAMFDNAFKDLKAGNYDLAILQFEEFIRQFPNSARTDDAQYWLAECYYGKRDYAKAIPEFEKVEKLYKDSDKLGPAMFKMARSYEETGNNARACAIFKRITTEFADSFESRQAGDKLKDLQCP